ncbi:hypothetical protein FACS1894116_11780 [Betaproteobacteria bacterium]|nr:hypothetical protein FACS1894116_11780 [Betaproteobacteria bacterium]
MASFAKLSTNQKIAAASVVVAAAGVFVTLITSHAPTQTIIGSGNNQAGRDVIAPVLTVTNNYNITHTVSREEGVPLAVVKAMFLSMGGKAEEFDPAKLEEILRLKAKEYNERKAELSRYKGYSPWEDCSGIHKQRVLSNTFSC